MVAVMEEARAVGVLVKAGWKPKRTIVFAAWDGEEQALLGSTEWVEDHAQALHGQGRRLHQFGHQLPRPARHRRLAQPRAVRQRDRAGGAGAEEGRHGRRPDPRQRRARTARPSSGRRRATRGCSRSRRSARARTTARSSSTSASPRSTSASAARANTASTTPIYDSIAHFERFMDPDYAYGVALAEGRRPHRAAPRRRGPAAVRVHARGRPHQELRRRRAEARGHDAHRDDRAQPAHRRRRVRAGGESGRQAGGAEEADAGAGVRLRAADQRRRSPDGGGAPLRRTGRRRRWRPAAPIRRWRRRTASC